MASNPVFAVTPRISCVNASVANGNRDGTGTTYTLITGASTGTRISEIVIKARVATTAGQIRVFLHDGASFFFFDEIAVAAATPSNSVQSARVSVPYANLILPNSSWSIRVATHNENSIDVTAFGADL